MAMPEIRTEHPKASTKKRRFAGSCRLGALGLISVVLSGCSGMSSVPLVGMLPVFQPEEVKKVTRLEGKPVGELIDLLGDPMRMEPRNGGTMIWWGQEASWYEQEWVTSQTGSQVVGMTPGGGGVAATPISQPTYSGEWQNVRKSRYCEVYAQVVNGIVSDMKVRSSEGEVCNEFIRSLRTRASQ